MLYFLKRLLRSEKGMKNGMKGYMGKKEYNNVESNPANRAYNSEWISRGLLPGRERMYEEWSFDKERVW